MAESLTRLLGVDRDVVSFVGAGGKTTLTFGLARDLQSTGRSVIVTTTTKMGSDQDGGFGMIGPDPAGVREALVSRGACLVVHSIEGHKANGVAPEWVDRARAEAWADAIVVEADGARRRKVKAPAHYEPVIPQSSTLVVAVMSMAAIGGRISEVAHRPDLVAALVGAAVDDDLTEEHAATVLTSDAGSKKAVPSAARYMVALTDAAGAAGESARRIAALVDPVPCVFFDHFAGSHPPRGSAR